MPLPIVGAHFRPPAKGILAVLPTGTKLVVRPEPTNEFDPNAMMVLVRTSEIPHTLSEDLELHTAPQGYSATDIFEQAEWHLGYIPKGIAAVLVERVKGDVEGVLSFNIGGKPMVGLPVGEDLAELA